MTTLDPARAAQAIQLVPGVDPAYDPHAVCAVAHGTEEADPAYDRSMVAVFAGDTARHICEIGRAVGYSVVVVEPDPALAAAAREWADVVLASPLDATTDLGTDVVVTDHHRDELGPMLRDVLELAQVRWIGLIGNPRVRGPHLDLLPALGVEQSEIDRVRRPIGLNIGSRTPAEIAVSTIAGLLADRAGRPGGFVFNL
jgi:xanthine dehydrogenase accessory factor